MLNHDYVIKALRNRLLDDGGEENPLPANRAWENEDFSPPEPDPEDVTTSAWIREAYLPGEEMHTADKVIECNGIYQLDVYWPKGAGAEEPNAIQKYIAGRFDPRTLMSVSYTGDDSETVNVVIVRTTRMSGRYEDDLWYVVPVQVVWRVHDILP